MDHALRILSRNNRTGQWAEPTRWKSAEGTMGWCRAELFCTRQQWVIEEAMRAKVHYDNDNEDNSNAQALCQWTSSKISQTRYGGPLSATNVLNDIESKTRVVKSSSTRFRWPRKFACIAHNNMPAIWHLTGYGMLISNISTGQSRASDASQECTTACQSKILVS